jgi:hypothetical protein
VTRERTGAVFRVESNTRALNAAATHALERGLRRVVIHWHGEARQRAPVDTGRLMSSIAFAAPGTNPAVTLRGSPPPSMFQPPSVRGLDGIVGTNVEYGPTVHELHRTHSGFIENPGNENAARYQGILQAEIVSATSGGRAAADD